jgi:gamma-glutamyltranspeptidase / glutathione hydrolase
MRFTYGSKREWKASAQRSVVMGTRGMVASSQPLATLAGLRMLEKGGNAVDAAVAMVSTLTVVEPFSVSLGGDAFALLWMAKEKKLYGMNGSGRAPYGATIEEYRRRGLSKMPERGILAATVPGALHGWISALEKFGRLQPSEVFANAIERAAGGFAVSEVIAGEWREAEPVLRAAGPASAAYLIDGKAPRPGQRFVNPDLARTYQAIVQDGLAVFYEGALAERIVRASELRGGLFSMKDLKDHRTTWVEPVSTAYRGHTVYELPPNGQGMIALEMLNILESDDLSSLGPGNAEYLHLLIEAKKAAFSDRDRFITDPEFETVPVDRLLSREHALAIRKRIDPVKALPPDTLTPPPGSETVYVTAVDGEGNAASFISSVFMAFGSGEVVEGTGIVLQNRGNSFSLDPGHSNRLQPHKRPMHTIIPAMVFKDGEFLMSFGVMGGDMQPQGHVQVLVNLIDFGMNLQEAIDYPRVRHLKDMDIYVEDGFPEGTAEALEKKGHRINRSLPGVNQVGGGQAVYVDRKEGVLLGASDRRKDGCAMGR